MIKFKKINIQKLSAILLSGIILNAICGCSSKKDSYQKEVDSTYSGRVFDNSKSSVSYESEIESDKIEESSTSIKKQDYSESIDYDSLENDFSVDYLAENSSIESSIEESQQENKKVEDVIGLLEQIDNKITEKGYQVKDELVKDYGIVHDFIFENGTIKGYTFDELKDNIKAKALSIYLKIDEKIEKHFPQYKETIKEKYGNIKDKVKSKLSQYKNNFIEYLKNEIGEEKYNSFIETKNKYVEEFKEQTKNDFNELKELGGKAKEKVKSWFNKN